MAEAPKKKKTRIPWTTILLTGFGAALAYRGLVRPSRSVVEDGFVTRCAGNDDCSFDVEITSAAGKAPVYSVVDGVIVDVDASRIVIASANEPVLLVYRMPDLQFVGTLGAKVAVGQVIAYASKVAFSVYRLEREAQGQYSERPVEPTSWLAARGLSVSRRPRTGTVQWCEGGRQLKVPGNVLGCGIELPEPSSFLLLPVNVQTRDS